MDDYKVWCCPENYEKPSFLNDHIFEQWKTVDLKACPEWKKIALGDGTKKTVQDYINEPSYATDIAIDD